MRRNLFKTVMLIFLVVSPLLSYADNAVSNYYSPVVRRYMDVYITTVPDTINNTTYDLLFNLYLPVRNPKQPKPLLIYIHGNGGAYNFSNGSRAYDFSIALANQGIAVATIDYRPGRIFSSFQENIWDVKAYIRYFRANAAYFNLDPDRFCLWGTSRGGQLSALLAVTGDSGNPDIEGTVGGNLEYSSAVQAAVTYYPIGGSPGSTQAYTDSRFDPVGYVDKNDPPTLIAVGGKDVLAPPPVSLALYNQYVAVGGNANLFMWSQGVHGRVGLDIEAYSSDWILNKLLVELAPQQ